MVLIGVALSAIALVSGSPTITMDNSYPVTVSRRSSKDGYDIGDLYNNGLYFVNTEIDFDTSTSVGNIYHFTSLKYDFQITNEPGFYLHQYYEFKPVFDTGVVNLIGIKLDAYTDQYQGAQMVSNLYIPYFSFTIRTDSGSNDFSGNFYGINNLVNTFQSNTYYFDRDLVPVPEGDDVYNIEFTFNVFAYDYATTERFTSLVSGDVYNSGYNSGYDSGYNSGYSEGYNVGNGQSNEHTYFDGYVSGYDVGVNDGYQEGYDYGFDAGDEHGYIRGLTEQNPYTFTRFFGAIADVPILYVRQLLGFDVFGVSALTILMSMVTGVLVLFLLRRIVF